MTIARDLLSVDPSELHQAAGRLEVQASEFLAAHRAAQSRASGVWLGSGTAAASLPGLLAAWTADTTRLGAQFTEHADGHRIAAEDYVRTDTRNGGVIDHAAPAP